MRSTVRRLVLPTALAAFLAILASGPAWAHHGWEEYDTTRPSYAAGTVTDVRWGNPHPEVRIELRDPVRVPDDLAELEIPSELEDIGGREVLRATRAYDGGGAELHLVLAPIERLSAWGMSDQLTEGERVEVVGYVHPDHADELRPELLIREDGQVVRQRSVSLPTPVESFDGSEGSDPSDNSDSSDSSGDSDGSDSAEGSDGSGGSDGSDGSDPGEGGEDAEGAAASGPGGGAATATLWVLGIGAVLLVAGGVGWVLLRRGRS